LVGHERPVARSGGKVLFAFLCFWHGENDEYILFFVFTSNSVGCAGRRNFMRQLSDFNGDSGVGVDCCFSSCSFSCCIAASLISAAATLLSAAESSTCKEDAISVRVF
jgi:hypothetical protein